jgi:CRP-like cAMP-binding protein
VLGLAALLPDATNYFATTEAAEECWVLTWNKAAIRSLAARHPTLWENAFTILAAGFGGFLETHVSQACDNAPLRLARVLVGLAEALGQKIPGGIEVTIRNEDLAHAANVTLFTASRLLSEWQRNGLVHKTRGKVVVCSPEGLLLSQE